MIEILGYLIGGGATIWAAFISAKYLKTKQEQSKQIAELASVYNLIDARQKEGYNWLYDKWQFLDAAFDGYCIIDPVTQEEYISDGICKLIGRSRKQLGKTVADLMPYVVPVRFKQFEAVVTSLLSDDTLKRAEIEKWLLCENDQWARFNVTCVKDMGKIVTIFRFLNFEPHRASEAA